MLFGQEPKNHMHILPLWWWWSWYQHWYVTHACKCKEKAWLKGSPVTPESWRVQPWLFARAAGGPAPPWSTWACQLENLTINGGAWGEDWEKRSVNIPPCLASILEIKIFSGTSLDQQLVINLHPWGAAAGRCPSTLCWQIIIIIIMIPNAISLRVICFFYVPNCNHSVASFLPLCQKIHRHPVSRVDSRGDLPQN